MNDYNLPTIDILNEETSSENVSDTATETSTVVPMRSLLSSTKFQESDMELPMAIGRTISNKVLMADLSKMRHLLLAGATGIGKSVCLHSIITSLLFKKQPSELKFVLIDPKHCEFCGGSGVVPWQG